MNSLCTNDCKICGGSGQVRYDHPVHHPEFGKLSPCPEIPREKLPAFDQTGLEKADYDLGWSKVLDLGNTVEGVNAVKEVLDRGYGWVFLTGSHGLAKTLILKVASAVMFRRVGSGVVYSNLAGVVDDLRAQYDDDKGQTAFAERMRYWQEIPFLALDELDKGGQTPFVTDRRFDLLNARCDLATYKKGITLMAANQSADWFGPYIMDRLRDGRFKTVELKGPSARPSMDWMLDL